MSVLEPMLTFGEKMLGPPLYGCQAHILTNSSVLK